jgi:hypothetical protein
MVAAAIASVAISATTAGMSFAQAKKQRNLQQQAKDDAQKAMAQARKALEVNYYDQLAVQKEPYELEREALLSQGAMSVAAGVEGGSRGAAATAGRVAMAQNEAQAGIRSGMGKEMGDLAKLSAQEDSRLRDVGVQLDLAEVEGAQQAITDAKQAEAAAVAQGMEQVGSAVQQGLSTVPMYLQDMGAQRAALSKMTFDPAKFDQFKNLDFQKIGNMNNMEYRQFKNTMTPEQKTQLFQNEDYLKYYTPNPYQIF